MSARISRKRVQGGFSLLELLISVAIFVIISGAAFGLLGTAQKRYQTEGQVLSSFQEGRLALDQIVRDVNDAGYPPLNQFSSPAVPVTQYAVTPVAWNPGYVPLTTCAIGTCTSPGNFDVILEEYDSTSNAMQWIRYQLGGPTGTTLYRGTMPKAAGVDPSTAMTVGAGVMFPYATNVMNNASAAQIAQINAAYPGTFPGGAAVPIFSYNCDTATIPTACTAAGAPYNTPTNIRDIEVTLIIMTQQRDMQSGGIRVVTLNGRGHRINPNQ
jgi:prepilin-type N-terminal cleavage/methylation domain-containing protein